MRLFWLPLPLAALLFLSGESGEVPITGRVEKRAINENKYRNLILPNRLQVLLIRDFNATKAAVLLSIGVGLFNDPPELPGLAHFVEHAVFLGNARYPEPMEFIKYVLSNGGFAHAFTDNEQTAYFFDVAPSSLIDSLEQFSYLFTSPLFRESLIEKEVSAINSENERLIPNDKARVLRVSEYTANKSHPYFMFHCGNRDTLWTIPKANGMIMSEELRKFVDKYYSANIMKLVVLGPQPLDDLQDAVESTFSAIHNKNIEMPMWNVHHYGPEELQRWIKIVPLSDMKIMRITIPIPYSLFTPGSKPVQYVTSLLGHKGKVSLVSLLKKKNFVTSLETEILELRGYGDVQLKMSMTSEGLEEEVICLVFRYIDPLKRKGIQEWYWKEMKTLKDIAFRFQEKSTGISLVNRLSTNMLFASVEGKIEGFNQRREYNVSLIEDALTLFTPERIRVLSVSRKFESTANKTEPYYGVKYSYEKIDASVIKMWGECKKIADLEFPEKNGFIPSKFELKNRVENPGIIPTMLRKTPFSKIWFLQDSEFLLPKAIISLGMFSPQTYLDPLSVWLAHTMTEILKNELTEINNNAHLADTFFSVSSSHYGIELNVSGYDENLGVLFKKSVETLVYFNFSDIDAARFHSIKVAYHQKLQASQNLEEPKDSAKTFLSHLLRDKFWSDSDLLSVAIEEVTIERVAKYAHTFFSQMDLQWLFYGNLLTAESLLISEEVEALFVRNFNTRPLLSSQMVGFRDVSLQDGSNWVHQMNTTAHSNSAVVLMYQLGHIKDAKCVVIAGLLKMLAYFPFFYQLRIQEQLGYVAYTSVNYHGASVSLLFEIQEKRHPAYVYSRFRAFLSNFSQTVSTLTNRTFEGHKNAFLVVLQASKPTNKDDRGLKVVQEIRSQRLDFESEVSQLHALNSLTLDEFRQFYFDNFDSNGKNTRTVLVNVLSLAEGGAGTNATRTDMALVADLTVSRISIGEDVSKWKKQRSLYPMF